jgi:hypothetical protein
MIYILLIWTVVGASDSRGGPMKAYHDWRPLGEFHAETNSHGFQNSKTAQQMCEDAARQLGLKSENYRCVRSK